MNYFILCWIATAKTSYMEQDVWELNLLGHLCGILCLKKKKRKQESYRADILEVYFFNDKMPAYYF